MRTHTKSFYSAIFRGYFIDENCFEYPTDQASKLAVFFFFSSPSPIQVESEPFFQSISWSSESFTLSSIQSRTE